MNGLTVIEDFITEEEETDLLEELDGNVWDTTLSRRTQQYGYAYGYRDRRTSKKVDPVSGRLKELNDYVSDTLGEEFNQCIVNEYKGSQGIAPHIDHKDFGPTVVIISLGEDCNMVFSLGNQQQTVWLKRRSIIVLEDEARYVYKHSIPARLIMHRENGEKVRRGDNWRRVSVTFRTR
jgi:alkylated DNA repair dioxygenase AlkB